MTNPSFYHRGNWNTPPNLRISFVVAPSSAWRHWGCVTKKLIENMKRSLEDPSDLDGYQDLKLGDQAKVTKAWQEGHVDEIDIPASARNVANEGEGDTRKEGDRKIKVVTIPTIPKAEGSSRKTAPVKETNGEASERRGRTQAEKAEGGGEKPKRAPQSVSLPLQFGQYVYSAVVPLRARETPTSPPLSITSIQTEALSDIDIDILSDAEELNSEARHAEFYFADENITFQVENTTFRLPSYFFRRDSTEFRDLLDRSHPTINIIPNVIRLNNVTVTDFERFIRVMYPSKIGKYDATTVEEWTSILTLADRWKFTSIRELAIAEIVRIGTPVDKILLGEKFTEGKLLRSGYLEITTRDQALTKEEGDKLGMEEVVKIASARQQVRLLPVKDSVQKEEIWYMFGINAKDF
ncbi:hypothetical protein AX16_008722 [Volvariella volvacea WC 439]|nr:hypothetical protein AX16_008722 [Volvariella volvacea WC 439]